jgi:L-malate glycosyltransferase
VPVRRLPSDGIIKVYPIAQIQAFLRMRTLIGQISPHIVHSYFFWSILFGRMLKREGKIRTLIENREDQGFNWGVHEYSWLRLTRSIPDRIICVSDAVKSVVMEREMVDPGRIVVIRNGVDPVHDAGKEAADTRRGLGLLPDHLVVGMVANFNRAVKGVTLFLDSVPEIVRAIPAARFLLLGRGQEEKALREQARDKGIEPYVIFAGYRPDIHRYYAVMDVSALTSLSEGLSITVLESMRCGLPVVATSVGGNPEVVVDGVTGYLVPPRDTATFEERIVRLLRDPDLRRRMGEEGKKRVEECFRLKDVADRYLQVYEGLIAAGSVKGS